MIKKFLKNFHLPTHVALSFCFFMSMVVFAISFGNPAWDYEQADGTISNVENIAATSSFAFVIAFWFIFDCFAYFEKDLKERAKTVLQLVSDSGLVLSILVIHLVFLALRPGFVITWMYYVTFAVYVALCCFVTYLRYKGREENPGKLELYFTIGCLAVSLILCIIFSITSDIRALFLFVIIALVAGAFYLLDLYLSKAHKHNRFIEEKGSEEKGLFIVFASAPMTIGFLPLWVYSFKDYGEGYPSTWLILCLFFLIAAIICCISSFVCEIGLKRISYRNNARTAISISMMFIGALALILVPLLYHNASSYPYEACYYMVAVAAKFTIVGFFALLYEEIRRTHPEPKQE